MWYSMGMFYDMMYKLEQHVHKFQLWIFIYVGHTLLKQGKQI